MAKRLWTTVFHPAGTGGVTGVGRVPVDPAFAPPGAAQPPVITAIRTANPTPAELRTSPPGVIRTHILPYGCRKGLCDVVDGFRVFGERRPEDDALQAGPMARRDATRGWGRSPTPLVTYCVMRVS